MDNINIIYIFSLSLSPRQQAECVDGMQHNTPPAGVNTVFRVCVPTPPAGTSIHFHPIDTLEDRSCWMYNYVTSIN